MSGNTEMTTAGNLPSPLDPAAVMSAFWAPCWDGVNQQTLAWMDALRTVGDPRAIQTRWLEAVGTGLEAFTRSPVFLEVMKRHLKAITDLKALQDQTAQTLAAVFGFPRVDDISGLFERFHSVERAIQGELKGIEARLGAVEARLGDRAGEGS